MVNSKQRGQAVTNPVPEAAARVLAKSMIISDNCNPNQEGTCKVGTCLSE
ncbi:uncharacterized protein RSE6_04924 [Rhynchosporium secalis]|uniref:Uncharacterized protein n=1 Tax=Rhynchosporium secalis TaxID=38038 RepID=A0A1E1M7S6_RHYSE|nr:uncharacterized protein RSE6_04924 [Rhynchosporium secalis]